MKNPIFVDANITQPKGIIGSIIIHWFYDYQFYHKGKVAQKGMPVQGVPLTCIHTYNITLYTYSIYTTSVVDPEGE